MTSEVIEREAAQRRDFVELHEDVSHSPLWNSDLAPTTIAQRTWSTWNIAALWIGMSVVISTYMMGASMIEAGMSWWQAMLTILLGNCIVLIPMLLNAHAGTKYGVSFPVLCRASFGTVGANVPAMLRAAVACGWFGIQTWIGGLAIDTLIGVLWTGWAGLSAQIAGVALHSWLAFFLFWLIQVYVIITGIEGIKWLETVAAPLLLAGGVALLWWAVAQVGGLGTALDASSRLQKQSQNFWLIFPPFLTASVGYWATLSTNIPDFTRYARSQRSQMIGQALGLPTTMTAFAFIGVAVTSATLLLHGRAMWNPVELVQTFDSRLAIVFATFIIFTAQLSTNMAANVVSPSNDFSHLNPRRISFVTGGLITAVIGIIMMPWKLMATAGDYIFTWLIGYSGLMGAIAGILICDYWLLRRQRLDLRELYDPRGRYAYAGGFNWRAMAALVVAIAPCIPGFLDAATGGRIPASDLFKTLYTYAWFITFAVAFILYAILMAGHPNLRRDV
ncbi:MAG TPA: NCS1 family nucleobase:cation symporter-1 [Tepidisphaeraceae bacterium]|nr:NCS1 family nucleobase:cation symporter-1 [Tepidisphaeraceae bacterium]